MRVKLNHNGRKITLNVHETNFLNRGIGLMFKSRHTNNLLFEFNSEKEFSIHSLFVFFPFLAIWLNDRNKVVESRVVNPFSFKVKSKKRFRRLVEIPINEKNKAVIQLFVGKEKFK